MTESRVLDPRCPGAQPIIATESDASAWLERMHAKRCSTCTRFNRTYKLIQHTRGGEAAFDFWEAAWTESAL